VDATSANAVAKPDSLVYAGSVAVSFSLKINISTLNGTIQNSISNNTDDRIILEFLSLNNISSNLASGFYVSSKTATTATINVRPGTERYYGTKLVTYSAIPLLTTLIIITDLGVIASNTFADVLAAVRLNNPGFTAPDDDLTVSFTTSTTCVLSAKPSSVVCSGTINLTFSPDPDIPQQMIRYGRPHDYPGALGFVSGYTPAARSILTLNTPGSAGDNAFTNTLIETLILLTTPQDSTRE
jgi:hypothetical protein